MFIFHSRITQFKEKKWSIWEFAVSVQNFSADKVALSAFEMLKSNNVHSSIWGPSLAQAIGTGRAAETSFEQEQW